MKLDRAFLVAVVTVDPGFGVLEFGRHGLALDGTLQMPELHFHVDNTPTADGATIRSFHMLVVTAMVDAMATSHEDDSLRRCEHVLAAYRAVTVRRAFYTTVGLSNANGETNAARLFFVSWWSGDICLLVVMSYLAMIKVLPQPLSDPTDAAVIAVVNTFPWVIVPQFTDAAIVPRTGLTTLRAFFRR